MGRGLTMKLFLIGANGQIGNQVLEQIKANEKHSVKAMVRKQEQFEKYQDAGVDAVLADLEGSVADLAKAMEGSDAVIFTAGSGGNTGDDKTLLIDLDGAVKAMEAAEQSGVNRFVMVSAMQAHNRENWHKDLRTYYVAKHYADRMLQNSKLTYSIVRPGLLLNEPGTGKVSIAENLGQGSIPREDVAKLVITAVDNEKTYYRSFDLASGEHSIEQAIESL
jgi:uncharacterized protein YbjT (DUF2867 family)